MTIPPDPLHVPWYEARALDVQEFSAGGVRTFAVVEGRETNFPVIFLHGLPGGAFLWAPVIEALGRKRRAIAPDQPGWGRSISRFGGQSPAPTPEGLARWLAAAAAAQGLDRFDLVAHGSGSWLALELLTADPARIRRLALLSLRLWEGSSRLPLLSRLFGRARWTGERVQHWLDQHGGLTPESREESRTEFGRLLGQDGGARAVPMLREEEFAARFPVYQAVLAAYPGAQLLLWGQHDPAAPASRIRELTAALPGADVHILTQAGHFPMLDQPTETARLLAEFLQD